jgi:hypothetical protein
VKRSENLHTDLAPVGRKILERHADQQTNPSRGLQESDEPESLGCGSKIEDVAMLIRTTG